MHVIRLIISEAQQSKHGFLHPPSRPVLSRRRQSGRQHLGRCHGQFHSQCHDRWHDQWQCHPPNPPGQQLCWLLPRGDRNACSQPCFPHPPQADRRRVPGLLQGLPILYADTQRWPPSPFLCFAPTADMPASQTAWSSEMSATVDIAFTIQHTRSLTAAVLFLVLVTSPRLVAAATFSAFTNRTSHCRCLASTTPPRAALPNPRIQGLSTGSSARTRYVSHLVASSSSRTTMTDVSIR